MSNKETYVLCYALDRLSNKMFVTKLNIPKGFNENSYEIKNYVVELFNQGWHDDVQLMLLPFKTKAERDKEIRQNIRHLYDVLAFEPTES